MKKLTIVLSLIALTSLVNPVKATTWIVTNTDDAGPGSLRDQIAAATTGDTITFDASLPGNTITLITGQISLSTDITIVGPGYDQLTIDANNNGRIFYISNASVSIIGLQMKNGFQNESLSNDGGAILHENGGNLTLQNIYFDNNRAINGNGSQGGAIGYYVNSGIFNADTCFFMNCSADNYGGAISLNANPSSAQLNACTFNANYADVKGIIFSNATNLNISNSTFSNNTAIQNSILYNGSNGGSLMLSNCTFSNNIAGSPYAGIQSGTDMTMINCTYTGNNEPVYMRGNMQNVTLTVQNNIFDPIGGAIGGNRYNVISNGGNICSDNSFSAYLTATNDLNEVNPMLGVLANNGGVTQTHALLDGSLAIDDGISAGAPTNDQTGVLRTGNPDCGAMEFSLATVVNNRSELKETVVSAYPNPTNGKINFVNLEKGSTLELQDAFGQIVVLTVTEYKINTIDISRLSNGIYFYRTNGIKSETGKIIKN